MNIFRIILKSLSKRKSPMFLIGLQVAISIWFFINIIVSIQNFYYLGSEAKKNLNYPLNSVIHIKFNPDNLSVDKYMLYKEKIINNPSIKFIGFYRSNESISIESDEKIAAYAGLKDNVHNGNKDMLVSGIVPAIMLESGIESMKPLEIIEGRGLTDSDYKQSNDHHIPILIGYSLLAHNVFNIGEEIIDKPNNRLYKVVGVLKEKSTWYKFNPEQGDYLYLDDKVVIPFNTEMYSGFIQGMMPINYYSVIDQSRNVFDAINFLKELANEIDLQVEVDTLENELGKLLDEMWNENIIWLIFSVFFIIMTIIGMVFIVLSSMISRKYEIGIRMALGSSITQICEMLVGELLVTVAISSSITMIYSFYTINYSKSKWYDAVSNGYHVSPSIVMVALATIVIIILIPAIVIVHKVNKLQPNELIGGSN